MPIFRSGLILLTIAALLGADDPAGRLFRAAQRAQRSGDSLQAYQLYSRAAALNPSNAQYALNRNMLRDWAALSAQISLGDDAADAARRITVEGISPSEAIAGRLALPPPRLQGSAQKKSFDIRGTARLVLEQVAAAYGIQLQFEDGYQGPASAFTFRMNDLSMAEAFRALETITNSFLVPVNPKVAMVYQDTTQRRNDSAPLVTAEIPIPERLSVQEAQEMVSAVQQVMQVRRIAVDPGRRMVFLRDQPGTVMAARQILTNLSRNRAQVNIEVELLSVSKISTLTYGLQLQNTSALLNLGTFLHNVPSAIAGFTRFATFGGGATFMGIGIADAAAFATVSRSASESIFRANVIALDGQAASLKVGDRYPIVTSAYVGSGGVNQTPFAPVPAIQFQDLGLILKLTPTVHSDGEMTLDVDAEQNALGGAANNDIPIITSRHFQGMTRLVDGEWAVLAGLMKTTVSEDRSGILGLGNIPILGRLFTKTVKTEEVGQVLIVLKPHLISLPPWETPTPVLWVGTETKPLSLY
ncbi:MAG: Type secretion system secretin RcpA/CpaC [Bryobacterales bacterium]|nr:Type secretion system secretin RcpA/CpaC [Bryobacterales bacterium]